MKRILEEIDLHVTNRCVNECPHCNMNSPEKMDEISGEKICDFLKEASELGAKALHITGGEPFLRTDIFDIMENANNLGMKVEIVTAKELSMEEIKKLKNIGVDYLTISIDGNKQYHDKLRRVGNFDSSIENIKKALSIGLKVRVNTFIWKENINHINEILKLTSNLGVQKHVIFYFTPIGRGEKHLNLWMDLKEWKEFFETTKEHISQKILSNKENKTEYILQKSFYENIDEVDVEEVRCRIQDRSACVLLCDGSLYPCVLYMRSDKKLGNIQNESLKNIWDNSEMWSYYSPSLNSESRCYICEQKDECLGRCTGYSHLLKKDNTFGDVRCKKEENIYPACVWMTEKIT